MRCLEHRERTAIGMCSICGKGICEECSSNLEIQSGKIVCKKCAISEKLGKEEYYSPYPYYMPGCNYAQPYYYMPIQHPNYACYNPNYNPYQYIYRRDIPAPSLPVGVPSKKPYIIGIIGGILLILSSFFFAVMIDASIIYRYQHFSDYPFWIVYITITISLGGFLHGLGYFGYFRNYGNNWGLYACAFSMITAVVLPLSFVSSITYSPDSSYNPYTQTYEMPGYYLSNLIIFGELFMGVTVVMFGWTLLLAGAYTGSSKVHNIAGFFQIIAGVYILLNMFAIEISSGTQRNIGAGPWYVLSFTTIFSTLSIYLAKLPTKEEIALAELISQNSIAKKDPKKESKAKSNAISKSEVKG